MNKIFYIFTDKSRLILSKIIRKEIPDNKWNSFLQFIKFGLVGVSNTIIAYVVYVVVLYFTNEAYLIANVASFIISVLNSFYWNNKYVFKSDKKSFKSHLFTLLKTFMAYGSTGLLLNSLLLFIWIDLVHISGYIAPIINLLITIPLNFILNKFWAFKSNK